MRHDTKALLKQLALPTALYKLYKLHYCRRTLPCNCIVQLLSALLTVLSASTCYSPALSIVLYKRDHRSGYCRVYSSNPLFALFPVVTVAAWRAAVLDWAAWLYPMFTWPGAVGRYQISGALHRSVSLILASSSERVVTRHVT